MPALNFKQQFADQVASGAKRQTIRAERKNPIKPGDTLYLYTGMRTKHCKKLGEATCTAVADIRLCYFKGFQIIYLNDNLCSLREEIDIAHRDGFSCVGQLFSWFDKVHGLPFEGQVIYW